MKHSNMKMKNGSDSNCCEEMIRWERILPRMVLRVLLIEPDYSTRHIIAALLRKCSYKVTAVPDGLKAWQTLKRKAPDIDLILTEVQLPALSGFPLLTLIMEHDICKSIPVIMMSSQDSVSMVLKCMSKGAADFLIKPVRRNELGNLWQHVWRRHAIRSPPQNTTLPQKKLKTASEDNSASNQFSGFVASAQKINECSEKWSEAQSTYRSPVLEAESTYMENMLDASQIKSSSKLSNVDVVKHEEPTIFESKSAKHDDGSGEESITFVLEGASCSKTFKSADLRLEQDLYCTENEDKDGVLGFMLSKINPYINIEIHGSSKELEDPSRGAINLIGTFDNRPNNPDENCRLSGGNTTTSDFDTRLELSLRCPSMSSCKQASEASEERQRLYHSNTSAFSWYIGSKLLQPFFPSPPITSGIVNNTVGGSHKSHKLSGNSVDNSCQYGGTNQNQKNGVTSDVPSRGHDNVFTSVLCAQSDVHSICYPKPVFQEESSSFPTSQSSQSSPESQNSEQHCHQCDEATYTSLDKNLHDKSNLDHARLNSPAASQTAGNNSLCHDGANHINSAHGNIGSGSDGNATSSVVTKNKPGIFSDSSCPDYGGFGGTKSYHSSQREAALEKFRLKRKERCYEKKVRYQSRKRLAEQRPRVKGQFVRQVHNDHPITDANVNS
ncbi:unnamed protein product [Lupinus luteus]|uniref:Two-component response regulator-like APRR5 n=1 Tax=Lupinus luteus TaxID=3873 RepID=A0AAV1X8Y9_LUPLU